jgi:hypothetical protein
MLKALQFDYENIPAIILKNQYYEDPLGNKKERFATGDTAILVLDIINILGNANNIQLSLQFLMTNDESAFQ